MTVTPSAAVDPTAAQEPKPKSAKAKTTAEPTEYVVLCHYASLRDEGDNGKDAWVVDASHVSARSAKEAIRVTVGKRPGDDQAGRYVAVPARSWRPVTVTDTECCEPYCWLPVDWTDGTIERLLRDREEGSDASGCTCGWPDAPCTGGEGIKCPANPGGLP